MWKRRKNQKAAAVARCNAGWGGYEGGTKEQNIEALFGTVRELMPMFENRIAPNDDPEDAAADFLLAVLRENLMGRLVGHQPAVPTARAWFKGYIVRRAHMFLMSRYSRRMSRLAKAPTCHYNEAMHGRAVVADTWQAGHDLAVTTVRILKQRLPEELGEVVVAIEQAEGCRVRAAAMLGVSRADFNALMSRVRREAAVLGYR